MGHAAQHHPVPVPFFPEVHEDVTKSWKALFTASSTFTALDSGTAKGYKFLAVLAANGCKFLAALATKAYSATG